MFRTDEAARRTAASSQPGRTNNAGQREAAARGALATTGRLETGAVRDGHLALTTTTPTPPQQDEKEVPL